jgi:hypothetical protein
MAANASPFIIGTVWPFVSNFWRSNDHPFHYFDCQIAMFIYHVIIHKYMKLLSFLLHYK